MSIRHLSKPGLLPAMLAVLPACALLLAPPQTAHAQTVTNSPLIDFTGGQEYTAPFDMVAGFDFTATSTQAVTGLGIFDIGANGLANSHSVGLFNSGGTLLGSVEIDDLNSSVVTSMSNLGNYRRVNLANTVTLIAGQRYVLGATFTEGDADHFAVAGTANGTAGFTYGNARYAASSTLTFPTDDASVYNAGFFGPMAFTTAVTASAVPEPSEYAVMGLLGATLLVGMVRARRKKALQAA